ALSLQVLKKESSSHLTVPTVLITLPLHDALPICSGSLRDRTYERAAGIRSSARRACRGADDRDSGSSAATSGSRAARGRPGPGSDRKSTRLDSSHVKISYAVFCLKYEAIMTCSQA